MSDAQNYVVHRVVDGKRVNPDAAATSGRWADRWTFRAKHAVQLIARANRLLRESESGLCIRDWGSDDTPASERYFLEELDGDDWTLIDDLPKFVAELAGGTEKGEKSPECAENRAVSHETQKSEGSQS